jgi:hypothetical protein
MPGVQCARSLVCEKKHTSVVTTVTPVSSGIPRATVLTVSFVLSPVIGLSCHRRSREALASQELDTSVEMSRPHDFAVRFTRVRLRMISVHRIPPRVRDDREPPLCGTGRMESAGDLGGRSIRVACGTLARRANQLVVHSVLF